MSPRKTTAGSAAQPRPTGVIVTPFTRRGFLKGLVGAGGLLLAAGVAPARVLAAARAAGLADGDFVPGLWLSLAPDGLGTIVAHRSEMGTGIRTTLPMVLADELGADWNRVKVE